MRDPKMFKSFSVQDAPDFMSSVSFLMRIGQVNTETEIKADAAGSYFFGFGSTLEDRWIQGAWVDTDH